MICWRWPKEPYSEHHWGLASWQMRRCDFGLLNRESRRLLDFRVAILRVSRSGYASCASRVTSSQWTVGLAGKSCVCYHIFASPGGYAWELSTKSLEDYPVGDPHGSLSTAAERSDQQHPWELRDWARRYLCAFLNAYLSLPAWPRVFLPLSEIRDGLWCRHSPEADYFLAPPTDRPSLGLSGVTLRHYFRNKFK